MKKFAVNAFSLVLSILLFNSCTINSAGYEFLSDSVKARVTIPQAPIDSLNRDGFIYKITDEHFRDFISRHDNVIVYDFSVVCKGEGCKHPQMILDQIRTAGYTPCLIAEDYQCISLMNAIDTPFLIYDFDYYKTSKFNTCAKRFFMKLGCDSKNWWYRYKLYQNGKFVRGALTLDELLNQ